MPERLKSKPSCASCGDSLPGKRVIGRVPDARDLYRRDSKRVGLIAGARIDDGAPRQGYRDLAGRDSAAAPIAWWCTWG
jgi:hypothetical protein